MNGYNRLHVAVLECMASRARGGIGAAKRGASRGLVRGRAEGRELEEDVKPSLPLPLPLPLHLPASTPVDASTPNAALSLPPALTAALARTINRAQTENVMCTQEYIQQNLPQYTLNDISNALQSLIGEFHIRVTRLQNGDLCYSPLLQDVALALKGLNQEEQLVYRLVESAQREGIWTKTLKTKANVNRTFPKIIKHLEGKKLIKCFKSITSKYKKIYILFDLEPADHHKGGVWYDSKLEFDHSFVKVLKDITLQFVRSSGSASIANIARFIEDRGVSQVKLGDDEVRTLANALLYDGLLESVGSGPDVHYKPAYASDRNVAAARTLGAASITPCLHCPVFHLCGETADITPANCIYMNKWFDF